MSTSPLTFHENYGTVSKAQLAAYKRLNVSPLDHDLLVDVFGEDDHAGITAHVKANSEGGMYREPPMSSWGW
jgi:hypothetical protein